jgi:hypothetical protein
MSGFKIITADERMAGQGAIKGLIAGTSKVGKTSLLWTLDAPTTLFVNLEAGELSVQGWTGDSVEVRTWGDARNLACFLGGPNPALRSDQIYSQAHYNAIADEYHAGIHPGKYITIFVDSITEASRLCWQWCTGQPDAFSEKTGKPDTRGTYGLLGREMIAWLKQLQHAKNCNVWFVCLLDSKKDDFGRTVHDLQIEGSKTGLELPGIVDQVITMSELTAEEGTQYRAFVCTRPNPWGFPAGDRSCKLDQLEPPHLGRLMEKIKNGAKANPASYIYTLSPQEGQPHEQLS